MLTYPASSETVRDERPSYRPYRATVARIVQVSPSFKRVTFTGEEFETFGTAGLDQRIKVVLPHADGGYGECGWFDPEVLAAGTWYQRWRELDESERNPFRTYTVRAIRQAERELDVDFVVHDEGHDAPAGPAAAWLAGAEEGDEIVIVGPDDLSVDYRLGLDWRPGDAIDYLLAGDETAAPAICSILESLPAGTRAHAFIEVPHPDDAIDISTDADVSVTWLGRASGGLGLQDAVRAWVGEHRDRIAPALAETEQELADIDVDVEMLWDSPEPDSEHPSANFYAWLAGESACIKALRRLLVTEVGVDRHRVAFMGYWRLGKAEAQ
ncbi:siderophore-interacting protein [Herbiconiux sp. CPCC 205763]|uniref:Siderophore-interacting protein n=1 Tax=Herbiconiux aconitum TaxID=2970913 RepID=A0ABT2GRI5_9MICO|nr:siderophore-interacting protein [Herbiconiux aconitum]MCS5718835.1 siderophore-interacting protein [Herbiconiux aconitum]